MGEGDEGPFPPDLGEPAQEKASEASSFFDLAEHEIDDDLASRVDAHSVRRATVINRRIDAIKSRRPLTLRRREVIEPARLFVETLLPQLRAVSAGVARLDEEIARRCQQLSPTSRLFENLPGAGRVFSAQLLAAFGEQRDRFADASAFQKYACIAPVTERSGNKHWVHWRWSCPTFLRQTFVEWVASSVPHSFWARAFYESHRARGASHNATVRALAFKWTRILYRCWVDRTPYNESRYLDALQKRQSPLLKFAAQAPS